MRPLLSVVIPVYNAQQYLNRCLTSVLNQDFEKGQLEVVCVNDGSTDGSGEWLDIYSSQHPEVKVIHKENGGISSARNCGMEAMSGRYFEFVDADDELIPHSIFDIVNTMIMEQCEVSQFDYTRGGITNRGI